MDEFVLKLIQQLGISGLAVFLLYKLLDKYFVQLLVHMGKFVESNAQQVALMSGIAKSTGESLSEQNQISTAIRVMSRQIEQLTGRIKEFEAMVTHK